MAAVAEVLQWEDKDEDRGVCNCASCITWAALCIALLWVLAVIDHQLHACGWCCASTNPAGFSGRLHELALLLFSSLLQEACEHQATNMAAQLQRTCMQGLSSYMEHWLLLWSALHPLLQLAASCIAFAEAC